MNVFMRATAIALAVGFIAAAPAARPSAGLNDAVQSTVQAIQAPAAQAAVVEDGKLIFDRAYGFANVDRQVAATPETQFEIGSVTKQFTSAAILQLKEQGKLSLTDPLGKYVPEYARGKNITLEQLMWQVSGIPEYLAAKNFLWISGHKPGGLLQALALIENKPLDFKPGSKWAYSNTNYLLLGYVVARVSHMPWETYVRKNLFARAGMRHSAFIQDEASLPNMATGYDREKNHLVLAPPLRGEWAGGAGAIVSTASDLAKWDIAYFNGKIISPADVTLATTAHVLPSGKSTSYGFGWVVGVFEGEPQISHSGGTWGFLTENEYYPKLHQFVIALTNTDAPPAAITAAAFNALNPAIAAAQNKAAPGEDAKITALVEQWMHRLQTGDFDRSQLTAKASSVFSPGLVAEVKKEMAPLGDPTSFVYRGKSNAGGLTVYKYRVSFKGMALTMMLDLDTQGKIAGIDVNP